METMTDFHGSVGVDEWREPEAQKRSMELLLFNFRGSDNSKELKIFEKKGKQRNFPQGNGENYEPYYYGGVAQLGEHLPCKQGVMGSNPIISTMR